jgi:hypothetical protein
LFFFAPSPQVDELAAASDADDEQQHDEHDANVSVEPGATAHPHAWWIPHRLARLPL